MTNKPFVGYIHLLRGIAIIVIVLQHLLYIIQESNPHLRDALLLFSGNSSMLFVFISGFLFQYRLEKYQFSGFMKKRVIYVLMPYLLMSVPALVLYALNSPYGQYNLEAMLPGFGERPLPVRIILLLVYGAQEWHFWYIPMIFLVFMTAPLLSVLDRHPRLYWILPLLWTTAILIGRQSFAPLRSWAYFLPVFIYGMFLSRYQENFFVFFRRTRSLWLILLSGIIILSWGYLKTRYFELLYIQKLLLIPFFILLLKDFRVKFIVSGLSLLSGYSYTIYLIHYYMHMLIGYTFHKAGIEFHSEAVRFSLFFLLNIPLCVLAIHLAKSILGRFSRQIIGT